MTEAVRWPHVSGLSSDEAGRRQQTVQQPGRSSHRYRDIFRRHLFTPFNAVLGILAGIMVMLSPIDALFGLVLVANAAIGISQDLRAKWAMDRLSVTGTAHARVRRNGQAIVLTPDQVVIGDVLELAPGNVVFADGDVIEANGLEINESLLTGEAEPVLKATGAQLRSGSFTVAGSGLYLARKVGPDTYAAQISNAASQFRPVASELQSATNRLLGGLQWIILGLGLLLVLTEFSKTANWERAAIGAIAGVVPMVPEGLVLLTSLAFAVAAIRLAQRQCLVQELPAVEVLARVDLVVCDKTGTLTEDVMELAEVIVLADMLPVREALAALAHSDPDPNSTMRALRAASAVPRDWVVEAAVPFSSKRRWGAVRFAGRESWQLGAPDVLLADGDVLIQARSYAAQGLRVLALVRRNGLPSIDDTSHGEPAGLIVLQQKVRPDAAAALAYFAEQGVAIKVLSGDDALTVGAVAARLGLPGAGDPIDARELPTDPDALSVQIRDASIFGRVSPEQKQHMIEAWQRLGHVVAMTGDGVNDALALKTADIGIAMGSGADITRSVAKLVLLDNRFASLPVVVAEGRRVLGNLERVAHLFLTKTAYAILLAAVTTISALPYPFLPRHITLVGSLTIGIPAFLIALEPSSDRFHSGFLNRVLRFSIPAGCLVGLASLGTYFLTASWGAMPTSAAWSSATIVLFLTSFVVLAAIVWPPDRLRALVLGTMLVSFAAVLAIAPLRTLFALTLPEGPAVGLCLFTAGMAAAGISGVAWMVRRRG